jgi:hypothetical protein
MAVDKDRRQVLCTGQGSWISGPCADITKADVVQPVPAEHVEPGDRLILDGGIHAEVDTVHFGFYHFAEGRSQGIAIGYHAGTRSGVLFRKPDDLLSRKAGDQRA